MEILLSGSSGFIGQALLGTLVSSGHRVVPLVRRPGTGDSLQWDPARPPAPEKLSGFDGVVHLAGKNIAGRWTRQFKDEIRNSRITGTSMLSQAVAESFRRSGKPEVLIAASAIGFYGDRGSERLTEERAPGSGFLSQLCVDWEAASAPAREAGVRVIHLRIGMVLGRGGGALPPLLTPFRLGLGGRIGSGKQYWSWVSLDDLVHMIVFGLPTKTLAGAVNAVGPEPVTNSEFTEALGEVLHRPTLFPLPEWVVRMALGEMGQALLLCSARVEAGKLKEAGYRFRHLHLREALHDAVM